MTQDAPTGTTPDVDSDDRLPSRVDKILADLRERFSDTWVGRIVFDLTIAMRNVEIFDRAMTIAAQFFTSVFPLIILLGIAFGRETAEQVAEEINVPAGTQAVLESAFSGGSTSFGLAGLLLVIISGTSLSRALTRTYAKVWNLARPKYRLVYAWRWVAVLTAMAFFVVASPVLRYLTDDLPPSDALWEQVTTLVTSMLIAVLVPMILLEGQVRARWLTPGAFLFGLAMVLAHPVAQAYLPRALATSAASYGVIGVAFTYLSYLYLVSFGFIGAAVIGKVLVCDDGWLGRWLRGKRHQVPNLPAPVSTA